jgi:hypothetical protein
MTALVALCWALPFATDVYEYTGWSLRKTAKEMAKREGDAAVDAALAMVVEGSAVIEGVVAVGESPLMKLYVYPPRFKENGILSYWYGNLTKALTTSKRRTTNPAEAEVFFLGIDTSCERNWPSYTTDPIEINYAIGDPDKCNVDRWKRAEEYLKNAEHLLYGQADAKPTFAGKGTHLAFDMTSWYQMPQEIRKWKQPIAMVSPSSAFGEWAGPQDISWPAKNLVDFSGGKCGV